MSVIAEFSRQIAALLPAIGNEEFPEQLIASIKQLVALDEASVIVYPGGGMPFIDYREPRESWGHPNLDTFIKGAFVLDPYYLAATKDDRNGFFQLKELAPSGFKQSEYYRIYYRHSGLQDECGYLIPTRGQGFINISLGRTTVSRAFRKAEVTLLADITPTIETLARQHWLPENAQEKSGSNLRKQLETALDCFGSSVLTERERQIMNMILHGYATKTIAQQLKISIETVKLHRKNAYAKLDINMQSELFYLFIDSLMSSEGYSDGDPLQMYLQSPLKSKVYK
ncbi:MAG: LuxR C-terminal-related transcriptional regulator [Pseudomonadales bacterium]